MVLASACIGGGALGGAVGIRASRRCALPGGSAPRLGGRGCPARRVTTRAMAVEAPKKSYLSKDAASSLIDQTNTFIFDCDGVIWKGDTLIDGVKETLDALRADGKRLIFVTNNSTKSRKQYLSKFESLGLTGMKPEEIFSSSFAAAAYLSSIGFKKKAYVIGEQGIQLELDLVGVEHLGGPSDGDKKIELKAGELMEHDHDVGAVIVGFDRYVNYYKLQYATLCLRENPGCIFIATNTDAVTHLTDAQEWAGGGAMVGAVKASSGKDPTIVGKPASFMLEYICDQFGIRRDQICMVGDRLDTDIMFGIDGGLRTLLCLSGVTTKEVLDKTSVQPDYFVESIAHLRK